MKQLQRQIHRGDVYRDAMTELMEALTRPGTGARDRAERIISRAIDRAHEGSEDDDY